MSMLMRELYWFAKDSTLFSLPILRKIRAKILKSYLQTSVDIKCGSRVTVKAAHKSPNATFATGPKLKLGSDVYIDFTGGVVIGDAVTVSEKAMIFTHDHIIDGGRDWQLNGLRHSNLTVGNYAWIGAGAMILNSVRIIGEGAIIAAGSIVTRDVPPYTVVAGNPAKPMRERSVL